MTHTPSTGRISVKLSLEKKFAFLRRKFDSSAQLLSVVTATPAAVVGNLNSQLQGASTISHAIPWPSQATFVRVTFSGNSIIQYDRLVATAGSKITPFIGMSTALGISQNAQAGYYVPRAVIADDLRTPALALTALLPRSEANFVVDVSYDSNAAPAEFAAANAVTLNSSVLYEFFTGVKPDGL